MEIRWLRRALKNLDQEAEYIAREGPEAAARIFERIVSSVERLASDPSLGRPGRVPTTRELVITGRPYIIPYRVRGDTVEILGVFHSARKWPDKF